MGVHHAWGRTLKDVFQRYKAMRGFDLRYQNGFDCQGLWVEVDVERALGLNSKREIEEYGLAEFAARCRERVAELAEEITEQSKRLGMWMDWGNDYFTFSDTNIEYIWRFLKTVHERGWLYQGHRSTEWCPRCGTSISQHELIGHPTRTAPTRRCSSASRCSTAGRGARRLDDDALDAPGERRRGGQARRGVRPHEDGDWVAVARYPDETFVRVVQGSELVGLEYEGPFDDLPGAADVEHRVIPWDEVSLEEGTGIVHIAPGGGTEDFELSKRARPAGAHAGRRGRPLLRRATAGCRALDRRCEGADHRRPRASAAASSRRGEITHRYPSAGAATRR